MYRNPRTDSYVPSEILWPFVLSVPATIMFVYFLFTRNKIEFIQANLAVTLALGLNGIITNVLKLCVGKLPRETMIKFILIKITIFHLFIGRPRPDFFWRCFPDGEMNSEMQCSGDPDAVRDGRKSFPSGHSSCK